MFEMKTQAPTADPCRPVLGLTRTMLMLAAIGATSSHSLADDSPQPAATFDEPMVLILADEFDGQALDTSLWKSIEYDEAEIKNDTVRGPDNVEVRDGNLLLHVRKEMRETNGKATQWTAAYVHTHEPIENNVYIEARMKTGKASGVNNAFWMACVNAPRHSYMNKYEIDIVEARKDIREDDNTGHGHVAWHDWKTYGYIVDDNGKNNHTALGSNLPFTWDEYHTWGLWYGESGFVYYLDGEVIWRGDTHAQHNEQWDTGVGKFDRWYDNEEKRAYGRFGQDDWSYMGGYNGDQMKIVFSNLPWGSPWTPFTDEADGDVMAVDYLRVYKPARLLATDPLQHVTLDERVAEATSSDDEGIRVALDTPMPLSGGHPWYFSVTAKKESGSEIHLDFEGPDDERAFSIGVDRDNHLLAGFDTLASTATAYPAAERGMAYFEDGKAYLLVGRVTPGDGESKPTISLCAFKLPMDDVAEPYFYRNIDQHGNTNMSQGWHINQKDAVDGSPRIETVRVHAEGEAVTAGPLKIGTSFVSVVPGDQR